VSEHAEIGPEHVRHFVTQEGDCRAVRTVIATDEIDADGACELAPGESFLGQLASALREGVDDGSGKFLHGFEERDDAA
jgi:hypothetical protein